MNFPLGQTDVYPGYQSIVFLHDNGIFSTVIVRPGDDRTLAALRLPEAFDAASRAIPGLATWTDPTRAHPYTPVLPGGRLHNTYRGQLDDTGAVAAARPGVRRRRRVHHQPLARSRRHHLAAAGPRATRACSTHDPHDLTGPPSPSTAGAPTTSRPGSTTTSTGTRS